MPKSNPPNRDQLVKMYAYEFVRFNHDTRQAYLVADVTDDCMLELEGMAGQFAPECFQLVKDVSQPAPPNAAPIDESAGSDRVVAHRCSNDLIRPYPAALCSARHTDIRDLTISYVCSLANHDQSATQTVSPTATAREADECQRYADAVVDAAIAWHESGQLGGDVGDSFEKGEQLTTAIERLLALRSAADMPRRWCSVHNREEFKYESLEHELHVRECSCGTEMDSGGCPNGH